MEPMPSPVSLAVHDQPIPASRGILLARNRRDQPFPAADLNRWLRYLRIVCKADKVDILAPHGLPDLPHETLERALDLQIALSLRVDIRAPIPAPAELAKRGLLEVCLSAESWDDARSSEWLPCCREAGLPIRIRVAGLDAFGGAAPSPGRDAAALAAAGVVSFHLGAPDPFRSGPQPGQAWSSALGAGIEATVHALQDAGIEATVSGLPFCVLDQIVWPNLAGERQLALDHQHYIPHSLELARKLHRRSPYAMGRAMTMLLARHTLSSSKVDNLLLPFILDHQIAHLFVGLTRRLTHPLHLFRAAPRPLDPQAGPKPPRSVSFPSPCAECSLVRICDRGETRDTGLIRNLPKTPVAGEPIASPTHFARLQQKNHDALDTLRAESETRGRALAENAMALMTDRPPARFISSAEYTVKNAYHDRLEGLVKWHSASNTEKRSSPLARLEPPFTLSVDVAGGIAEYAGFAFGPDCVIVCPMEAYRHTLTIHVEADGQFALLRDGKAVRPVEFAAHRYVPGRLAGVLEPRIVLINIDEAVSTCNIRLWEYPSTGSDPRSAVKFSILIVSTRFTRRLQAVLQCIAHQRDFDSSRLEVLVCYVPGIDATDDLIDSARMAYPGLRIVRAPFPEQNMHSKGLLINETVPKAAGEWIMLLDSDTLLPPGMFAAIDAASDSSQFMAPDGRKLLTPETTARILMGEVSPWDEWQTLMDGPGEFRHREANGIPVGFCQIVRKRHLVELPYMQMQNFEWADMDFGLKMRERVGVEYRLIGQSVLHLDHGSSQWFGTTRHL